MYPPYEDTPFLQSLPQEEADRMILLLAAEALKEPVKKVSQIRTFKRNPDCWARYRKYA